jgi:hypothetical protein
MILFWFRVLVIIVPRRSQDVYNYLVILSAILLGWLIAIRVIGWLGCCFDMRLALEMTSGKFFDGCISRRCSYRLRHCWHQISFC